MRGPCSARTLAGMIAFVAFAAGPSAAVSTPVSSSRQAGGGEADVSLGVQSAAAARTGRLVFVRATSTGSGLFTIRADGRGFRRLASGRDEEPAWSPDGSRLAFSGS